MRRWLFAASALVCTTALVAACGVGTDCDFGLCAGAVVGSDGGDSGPDVIAPPNGCKPELDPRDAAPCVVNDFGIFVAPNGKADAPGTREAPVNSIASALKIVGNKPRIYVCKGIYAENIELSTAVSIFGGFACGTWSYSSEKAVFGATAPGQYGLRVRSVAADIVIADIEVSAKPGDQTSLSSITAFVSDSPKLTLRRVTLIAGEGHDGSNGNPGTTGASTPSDLNGNPPKPATSGGEGGAAKSCSCSSGGTTKGGRGGDTLGLAISGADGETVMPTPSPATATGMAQTASDCLNMTAFRATLEEIADSDLLIHVVDASNPRVLQQIASVDKITSDLHFGDIPQLIVLNKTDLIEPNEIETLMRQITLDSGAQCVAISAIQRESLRPMVEMIGERIQVPSSKFKVQSSTAD